LQTGLQDIASPGMYGLLSLHGFIFQYLIMIMIVVGGVLFNVVNKFSYSSRPISNKYATYHVRLEIFWTIMPTIILLSISLPSFNLLYFMDSIPYADLTIKVIAHQWY
jgi:cytochrome c oxidase subunit 2